MERLFDLRHDLGKYLRLPLTMLPASATPAEVRAALEVALRRTRSVGGRARSAREIWQAFERELAPELGERPAFEAVTRAVEQALSWEPALDAADAPLDRAHIERDLRAVGDAIDALIDEL